MRMPFLAVIAILTFAWMFGTALEIADGYWRRWRQRRDRKRADTFVGTGLEGCAGKPRAARALIRQPVGCQQLPSESSALVE